MEIMLYTRVFLHAFTLALACLARRMLSRCVIQALQSTLYIVNCRYLVTRGSLQLCGESRDACGVAMEDEPATAR